MQIAHAALREDERDGQKNEQDCPEELHAGRCVLIAAQFLVAVLAGDERDAVKARGIKRDHGTDQDDQHQLIRRQMGHDGDDGLIYIAALVEEANRVKLAHHLHPQTIIAEDDKGNERAGHAEKIRAEDRLFDSAAAADAAHEERARHTPYKPIRPIEHRPVLHKRRIAQRIGIGAEANKVLHQIAERGEAGLNDVLRFSAKEQYIDQQSTEEHHAGVGEPRYALDAFHNGDGIHNTGDDQNADGDEFGAVHSEEMRERGGEQRRRN